MHLLSIDSLSTSLIPSDFTGISNPIALQSTGDGNCLYNAVSLLLLGSELGCYILRLLTSIELYENAIFYANHPVLVDTALSSQQEENYIFPNMVSMVSQDAFYERADRVTAIKAEAVRISRDRSESSLVAVMVLSSVVTCPIYSSNLLSVPRSGICYAWPLSQKDRTQRGI